ncbi:MAG TPA: 50S ribosomal protein L25 [Acidimicrobiia bacterium]|nr:50S ribosomal protein L25 [Acidimicrobiia bacterium]
MAQITLSAETGRALGTRSARRLRATGMVPAVVYGQGGEPQHVAVNHHDLTVAFHGEGGSRALINLEIDGGTAIPTLIKAIDRHPFRNLIRHVDFLQVSLSETVETEVTVHFIGTPAGAREGGILTPALHTVRIEALPTQIPPAVEIDVSELEINDGLRVADLPELEGVTYLEDPETLLVTLSPPTVEVEPEPTEEELEEAAGEEAGEEGAPEAEASESGEDTGGE